MGMRNEKIAFVAVAFNVCRNEFLDRVIRNPRPSNEMIKLRIRSPRLARLVVAIETPAAVDLCVPETNRRCVVKNQRNAVRRADSPGFDVTKRSARHAGYRMAVVDCPSRTLTSVMEHYALYRRARQLALIRIFSDAARHRAPYCWKSAL
jgi:hypothetical protein